MKSAICVVEKTKIVRWGFLQFSIISLSNGTKSVAMVLQIVARGLIFSTQGCMDCVSIGSKCQPSKCQIALFFTNVYFLLRFFNFTCFTKLIFLMLKVVDCHKSGFLLLYCILYQFLTYCTFNHKRVSIAFSLTDMGSKYTTFN